ncbi:MAG: TIGR03086 family protein [Nocardia sp.]|nr:TIGR03086 family protein [Nocardia sp.]
MIDTFMLASAQFERALRTVEPPQWTCRTPCTEWNVRDLVNHMTRGNLNYVALLHNATAADFLRERDADAIGSDPAGAYVRSVDECAAAFREPGAMRRLLDYPLGTISGRQALTIRITDTTIHTWDLAQALDIDDRLHPDLVTWISDHLTDIYAGLTETPIDPRSSHRFFAAAPGAQGTSTQERLLDRMGRTPHWRLPTRAATMTPQ